MRARVQGSSLHTNHSRIGQSVLTGTSPPGPLGARVVGCAYSPNV